MKPLSAHPVVGASGDYELEPELSSRQRSIRFLRSWRGMLLSLLLVIAIAGIFFGGQIYNAVKEWRMRNLLTKAAQAEANGQKEDAFNAVRSAYILVPGNLEALRAVARYYEYTREPAALATWQQIVENKGASLDDEVALCREALHWGGLDLIRARMKSWESRSVDLQNAGVLSIRAEIRALDGHSEEAVGLARGAVAAGEGNERILQACRLSLARVLLQASGSEAELLKERQEAIALLRELALGDAPTMRDALELLVRLALQPAAADLLRGVSFDAVVSHAGASPALPENLKVASWDLKLPGRAAPAREEVMREFSGTYHSADQPGALEAARWLNQHREFDRSLQIANSRMQNDESWFLVGMDALAAKGAWAEILERLSPARKPPLAPAVVQLFIFRTRSQLGQPVDPISAWRDVESTLNLESTGTQLYVAAYAEDLGYPAEAATIYRRMLTRTGASAGVRDQSPDRRKAYLGLLRSGSQAMTLDDLITVHVDILKEFPDMDDAKNDLYYLQLLKNNGVSTMMEDVSRLLARHPEMLSIRSTFALALLRSGRIQAADELYSGCVIDWAKSSDRCKVVRTAVLEAAGHHFEAQQMRSQLTASNLRDEEKHLAGLDAPP